MSISVGDTLPAATLLRMGENGPEEVELSTILAGRSVVLFGLPGPFTGTCTDAHVPSFIRAKGELDAAGVDEIVCFAVIDPFVMSAWSDQTGAGAAGLSMLADSSGSLTEGIGMAFDAPPVGLYGRSLRHAMHAVDGVVRLLHVEDNPGVCEVSAGESMAEAIRASA